MKVTVRKCDRCGELEADDAYNFVHITIKITNVKPLKGIYGNHSLSKTEEKDLCPTCAELLKSFMKGDPPPNLVPALVPIS